ncbi:DUF4878 domain-containing protein [Shewanella sp. OMA3-2]|uniref:DUF4878 domain-containing protein n=1 Tax=Shewanella sp. OMA3-2 TaxID=2908650 RepID=UPI001F376D2A|nr:DUF4878 domain-containing protein [Shewanella sp. OMA3-2]UJF23410.1 DUF4878 domain-containing protein [Shewanella sp. OMA3-2]
MFRFVFIFSFIALLGCEKIIEKGEAPQTPESVTLNFFEAIYNDRDVSKALPYVTPELREVLQHYHIASSVQRHVLGLSMTKVNMSIDEIDIDFFRKFTDEVTIIVKMEGLKGGRPWVDDRTLRLKKEGNKWIIVEVIPEKGRISG